MYVLMCWIIQINFKHQSHSLDGTVTTPAARLHE